MRNKRHFPPETNEEKSSVVVIPNLTKSKNSFTKCLQKQYMRAQLCFLFLTIRPGQTFFTEFNRKWCNPTAAYIGGRLLVDA